MAGIEELQSQANALLGSAASQSEAVTAALAEDDPGAPFSAFIPEQAAEAGRLAESLAAVADDVGGEDGVEAALERARELAREQPPQLVQHALHLFIVHHPEGSRLSVPPIEPIVEGDEGGVVTADLEETRREAALDYLRLDPLANEHHRHWHVVYPTQGWDGRRQDREGELFFYMHQQMLARYDADRRAVGLDPVAPFDDYRAPIGEGFRDRPPDRRLVDVNVPAQGLELTVDDMEGQRDAIFTAVRAGDFRGDDLIESLDALGQAEEPQLGTSFGGWHHGTGHMTCAWIMHPNGDGEMGRIGTPRTAIQDPFFWRWHRHVDNMGFELQEQFDPHDFADAPAVVLRDLILCFEDQLPASARADEAAADDWARETFAGDAFDDPPDPGVSTDALETSMAETPFDPTDPQTVPVRHLTHRPFCVAVRMRSEEAERKRVTVRLFLVPEEAAADRRAWIELDKFDRRLEPGDRMAFCRPMRLSSVARKPTAPEPVFFQPPAMTPREQYCRCGWPYHLLVPRGTEAGMPFRLAAVITDFALDNLTGEPDCGSLSFCGSQHDLFPDRREMGYPFNRPFDGEIDAVLRGQSSMAVRDLTVRHSPGG